MVLLLNLEMAVDFNLGAVGGLRGSVSPQICRQMQMYIFLRDQNVHRLLRRICAPSRFSHSPS